MNRVCRVVDHVISMGGWFITCLFFLISFCFSSCATRFVTLSPEVQEKLSNINYSVSEDTIEAYNFKKYLGNILGSSSSAKEYNLEINLQKTQSGLIIQKDTDSVRETIELSVTFKLFSKNLSEPVYKGKFRQVGSFNTLFSPYSTNLELERTSGDLYVAAAEELRRRLILYFQNSAKS